MEVKREVKFECLKPNNYAKVNASLGQGWEIDESIISNGFVFLKLGKKVEVNKVTTEG